MANFDTYITEEGWRTLLNNGLLNSITSFKAGDDTIIYGIEESSVKPNFFTIPLTGSREGMTKIPTCSFSERKPIPVTPPQSDEVRNLDSRVKLSFVSDSCSIPFEKNNLTVRVNIEKWIEDLLALKSTDYTRNASGLKINIWDYILAYLEEYNVGTKEWILSDLYKSSLDISYKLLSPQDIKNYELINPKYMELNSSGSKVFVNGQNSNRFPSNMFLSFNTKQIEGFNVFGTSNTLALFPDRYGYVSDNIFYNAGDLEDKYKRDPKSCGYIYPAIIINDVIYELKQNRDYQTQDGVGYFVWGYKDKDGNPAINGLTDKLKLFMKYNGEEVSTGIYRIVINLMTTTKSDKRFNTVYQNKKVGGELTYELYYNENTVSTDLYTIS